MRQSASRHPQHQFGEVEDVGVGLWTALGVKQLAQANHRRCVLTIIIGVPHLGEIVHHHRSLVTVLFLGSRVQIGPQLFEELNFVGGEKSLSPGGCRPYYQQQNGE